MIQNPEIAQSYILLNILRQQKCRIQSKNLLIPPLQAKINRIQNAIRQKKDKTSIIKQHRKTKLLQFTKQLTAKQQYKQVKIQKAQNNMRQLRANLAQIRQIKKQVLNQTKYQQQTKNEQQQLQNQISYIQQRNIKSDQLSQLNQRRSQLLKQFQIGKQRGNLSITKYTNQVNKLTALLAHSSDTHRNINIQSKQIDGLKKVYQQFEIQLYELKLSTLTYQQQRNDKIINIDKALRKISSLSQEIYPLQTELNIIDNTIFQNQNVLENKLDSCKIIGSKSVETKACADLKQRQNRLIEHRIDCIKLLIKRLYGCRDRLINWRRNNSRCRSSNTLSGCRNQQAFGKLELSGLRLSQAERVNNLSLLEQSKSRFQESSNQRQNYNRKGFD